MPENTPVKSFYRFIIPTLVFLLVLPVYSRGIWELVFNLKKFFPYVMQFVAVVAGMSVLVFLNRRSLPSFQKDVSFWFLVLFFIAEIVSAIITLSKAMYVQEVLVFCFIIAFLLTLFQAGGSFRLRGESQMKTLVRVLFVIGSVNLAAGVLEQLAGVMNWVTLEHYKKINWMSSIFNSGGFFMPFGLNIIRPTGITGSFLHFPLVMPVLGALVIRFEKSLVIRIFAFLFILIPFTSMSRSGMVLSTFILLALALQGIRTFCVFIAEDVQKRFGYIVGASALIVAAVLAVIFVPPLNKLAGLVWLRVSDFGDMSNTSRFKTWASHLQAYLKTNLIFGEYAGYSTNIVSNILGYNRLGGTVQLIGGVPESGVLSILIGTGLAGLITYYGVFIVQLTRLFRKKEFLLGSALLGATVQTFFYQSTEVLPFMFTLALIPLLANSAFNKDQIPTKARIS